MDYAHTLGSRVEDWEPLESHLRLVAGNDRFPGAAGFAAAFDANEWGRILGLWHDLGKFAPQFQDYLRRQNRLEAHLEQLPGRVDHSTAGAKHAVNHFGREPCTARVLAYCIAGHHAGLPDWNTESDGSLRRRLAKSKPETLAALAAATPALLKLPSPAMPSLHPAPKQSEIGFQLAFFIRMLFSCLVDADFLATEQFMAPDVSTDRSRPPVTLALINEALEQHLREIQAASDASNVNRQRQMVLQQCLNASADRPGFFSLTVPTGGGKTLSSLAFALRHSLTHGHRRIVYAVPFTSIVEQNADVFRKVLGVLAESGLIEHHSNLTPERETAWNRLASENWDAPLVVTTNVQLFESLFAARTSQCRKLHNLVGSVIILDEAQTIPVELLQPCLLALEELVRNYRCTIVLCTATQPAIYHREDFQIGIPQAEIREIIPEPRTLFQSLKRVRIEHVGRLDDDQLVRQIASQPQALCIVNTTRHAASLYDQLSQWGDAMHLSGRMCPEHRSVTIRKIRQRLKRDVPCRVISTQLIEAGVDIDFPAVFRAITGFDSIAQAAGRCNREGHRETGRVVLFQTEQLPPRGHLRNTAEKALELIDMYTDPLDLEAIEHYFRIYYWCQEQRWDHHRVLECFRHQQSIPMADFQMAAERFQMIPEATRSVIVPWRREGEAIVEELRNQFIPTGVGRNIRRKLQRYTVQVREFQWQQLCQLHAIELVHEQYPVLNDSTRYRDDVGLVLDDNPIIDASSLVV